MTYRNSNSVCTPSLTATLTKRPRAVPYEGSSIAFTGRMKSSALISAILLSASWSAPALTAPFTLCVQNQTGNVRAVSPGNDCSGLPGNWSIFDFADDDWSGAGTGALRPTHLGDRVGVGHAQPTARLHVRAAQGDAEAVIVDSEESGVRALAVTAQGDVIVGSQSGANSRLTVNAGAGQEVFRARADGTTALYVGQSGRTGIRNAAPQSALHVGAIANEDPLRIHRFGLNQPELIVNSLGNLGVGIPSPSDKVSVLNMTAGRAGFFRTENESNISAALAATTNGQGNALFGNILNPQSTSSAIHGIHSGGGAAGEFDGHVSIARGNHQLLIRDTDNAKTWSVTSHQDSAGIGFWENGPAGTGRFLIRAGGNVGIGTTDPITKLHVQGNSDGTDLLIRDTEFARARMVATSPGNDVTLTVQARGSAGAQRAEIGTISNHNLVFFANGSTRIVVQSGGGVCIGNC
jgi:hypothetical protein